MKLIDRLTGAQTRIDELTAQLAERDATIASLQAPVVENPEVSPEAVTPETPEVAETPAPEITPEAVVDPTPETPVVENPENPEVSPEAVTAEPTELEVLQAELAAKSAEIENLKNAQKSAEEIAINQVAAVSVAPVSADAESLDGKVVALDTDENIYNAYLAAGNDLAKRDAFMKNDAHRNAIYRQSAKVHAG